MKRGRKVPYTGNTTSDSAPLLPFVGSRFRWKPEAASQATGTRVCVVVAIEAGRRVVWRFEDDGPEAPRRVCLGTMFSKYVQGVDEGGAH